MLRRKISRARTLGPDERTLLARAWADLAATRATLAARGLESTRAGMASVTGGAGADVATIVRAVDIAARNQPGASCLPRALVLDRMLRRAGHASKLFIGARKIGDKLEAHAWVTVNGVPVGEPPGSVDRYTAFPDLPPARSSSPTVTT